MKEGPQNLKNQTQTCTQRINQFLWKCQNQVQQTVLLKRKDQPITGAGKRGHSAHGTDAKLNLGNELNTEDYFICLSLGNGISIYCQKLCQCLNSSLSRGATRSGAPQHELFLNSRERGSYPIGRPMAIHMLLNEILELFHEKIACVHVHHGPLTPPTPSPHSHPTPVFCFGPFVLETKWWSSIRRFSQIWPM